MFTSTRTLKTDITINCEPQLVITTLRDFQNLSKIHPLVVSVETLPPETAIRKYRITDKISFGIFSKHISYTVSVLDEDEFSMTSRCEAALGIESITKYTVTREGTRCKVEETTNVTANSLLMWKAFGDMQHSHKEMLKNLKNNLEEKKM